MADPQLITIRTSDGPMLAHLWTPSAPTGPGLVLLHEIFGVGPYMRDRAADLAALGYVVCVPELFWRLGPEAVDKAPTSDLQQAVGYAMALDWDTAVSDGVVALEHLRGRLEVEGGVGVFGFCFGGGLAFAVAAADDPDVLVSYYGSALPNLLDLAGSVTAPSLHHFGLADDYLPPDTVATIEAAVRTGPQVEVEKYPGAGHAFDNPDPAFHHPESSRQAWGATVRFLHEQLPRAAA